MKDKLEITKTKITTTGTGTTTGDFANEEWKEIIQNQPKITFPDNSLWYPQPADQTWKIDYSGENVKARCYNRNCKNETDVVTQLKLGTYLEIKTYICEACLSDLAEKIKDELGLETEEEK